MISTIQKKQEMMKKAADTSTLLVFQLTAYTQIQGHSCSGRHPVMHPELESESESPGQLAGWLEGRDTSARTLSKRPTLGSLAAQPVKPPSDAPQNQVRLHPRVP